MITYSRPDTNRPSTTILAIQSDLCHPLRTLIHHCQELVRVWCMKMSTCWHQPTCLSLNITTFTAAQADFLLQWHKNQIDNEYKFISKEPSWHFIEKKTEEKQSASFSYVFFFLLVTVLQVESRESVKCLEIKILSCVGRTLTNLEK